MVIDRFRSTPLNNANRGGIFLFGKIYSNGLVLLKFSRGFLVPVNKYYKEDGCNGRIRMCFLEANN